MERSDNFLHEASYLDQEGQFRTSRVPVVQEIARRIAELNTCLRGLVPTVNKYGQLTGPVQTRGPSPRAGRASKWGKSLGHVRNQGPRCTWSVFQGVRDVVKEFFGLSYVSVDNMGYGRNFVKSEDQPLDWIDRVTMKAAPAGATQGLHVWPQRPAIFRCPTFIT
ncbi:unnamed protein product [Prunus armeniaca]|uniref:Uncharacterized protein n=1 Tax=Prunus armeniaca TaxID=36596 RepID=A0A6J5YBW9_PRUAR|nr:unnamed protein product [Prunus armeniaca]